MKLLTITGVFFAVTFVYNQYERYENRYEHLSIDSQPVVAAAKESPFDSFKTHVFRNNESADLSLHDAYDGASGYRVQFANGVMRVTDGTTKMMEDRVLTEDNFDIQCIGNYMYAMGDRLNYYICEASSDLSVPARSYSGEKYQFKADKGDVFLISGNDPSNEYYPPAYSLISEIVL